MHPAKAALSTRHALIDTLDKRIYVYMTKLMLFDIHHPRVQQGTNEPSGSDGEAASCFPISYRTLNMLPSCAAREASEPSGSDENMLPFSIFLFCRLNIHVD